MGSIFVERLQKMLEKNGMSQKDLAQQANLTESAISHYLKGDREPKGAILMNIANVLGTSMDYLKGKTEEDAPKNMERDKEELFDLVARNARHLTDTEKAELAKILFSGKRN